MHNAFQNVTGPYLGVVWLRVDILRRIQTESKISPRVTRANLIAGLLALDCGVNSPQNSHCTATVSRLCQLLGGKMQIMVSGVKGTCFYAQPSTLTCT